MWPRDEGTAPRYLARARIVRLLAPLYVHGELICARGQLGEIAGPADQKTRLLTTRRVVDRKHRLAQLWERPGGTQQVDFVFGSQPNTLPSELRPHAGCIRNQRELCFQPPVGDQVALARGIIFDESVVRKGRVGAVLALFDIRYLELLRVQ